MSTGWPARNKRNAHEQYKTRFQAHTEEYDKQRQRRDQAVEELGEKFSEVSLELFNSLSRQLNNLRSRHLLAIGRAQPKKLGVNLVAENAFYVNTRFK